jgi:hypothetical protein
MQPHELDRFLARMLEASGSASDLNFTANCCAECRELYINPRKWVTVSTVTYCFYWPLG